MHSGSEDQKWSFTQRLFVFVQVINALAACWMFLIGARGLLTTNNSTDRYFMVGLIWVLASEGSVMYFSNHVHEGYVTVLQDRKGKYAKTLATPGWHFNPLLFLTEIKCGFFKTCEIPVKPIPFKFTYEFGTPEREDCCLRFIVTANIQITDFAVHAFCQHPVEALHKAIYHELLDANHHETLGNLTKAYYQTAVSSERLTKALSSYGITVRSVQFHEVWVNLDVLFENSPEVFTSVLTLKQQPELENKASVVT
jgi:hypothetical protein